MKTHNTDGVHQIDVTRGRKNTNRAGSRGIDVLDAATEVTPVTTILFPDFTVTDGDEGVAIVTYGGSSGTGTPGWINPITDYGAVGDGTTDDTAAINDAIAALNTLGKGTLYFPPGTYKVTAALTPITADCTVRGDGKAGFDGLSGVSQINCTSATAALFTFTPTETSAMTVRDIGLANTAGTDPSAGAAIVVTTTDGLGRVDLESVSIHRFYDCVDMQGVAWTVRNCWITHPVRYGIRARNVNLVDGGDWSVSDTDIFSGTYAATAALRVESGGGGKIVNTKINEDGPNGGGFQFVTGMDVNIATGIATSVLTVSSNSIENVSGDAIRVTTAGTGKYGAIAITGNEVFLYGNNAGSAVELTAAATGGMFVNGGIGSVAIAGNSFGTDGTARVAIALTNTNLVTIGPNTLYGFTSYYSTSGATNTEVARRTGTAFPANPATNDTFLRTDGSLEYIYDGTRWVCVCAHDLPMPPADAILPLAATTNSHRVGLPQQGTTIRLYSYNLSFFVSGGTALSASHKWTLRLKNAVSAATIATATIDSGASNAWRFLGTAVNANVALTEFELEINSEKTGTPGSLYVAPMLIYRIVNT